MVQPLLDAWGSGGGGELEFYAAGTDGPEGAKRLLRAVDGMGLTEKQEVGAHGEADGWRSSDSTTALREI